ncbi:hypothetical protein C4901_05085 [Acidiferrobacter sp. SPIII_3]|uniref:hypothetical protein n=1 Tax=Acidiferrobacter sp. SPIII_3 TaxID=1281578 RepID=UPI000D72A34E|nr:hypothetical protein [Acidiferrobacter sp. SPIII_3]AWP22794.1 hypothetical protein C4901_05085 [Acidiferrobacter sp. SPIII_3]
MNAKSWWRKAVLLEMGLGVGLAMCMLVTAQAGTIPASQEPQVLVILDTSQGMAGNLQGAIMSGSGTVAANADSASPPCYLLNSYTPRSTLGPSSGGSCPAGEAAYTVSVGGVLTDNSESMINVAEQGILSALNNPTYTNIMQAGLMAYATAGTPAPYDTWVYYMSGDTPTTASPGAECTPGAFGYGSTSGSTCAANDPLSVPNPCYKAPKGGDCAPIANIIGSGLTSAPYLYISQSSDDPQINDVLYWSTSYPSGNFVTYDGPHPSNPYPPNGYSLSRYEDQILSGSYLLETYKATAPNIGAFATSPTDAGYIPYSGEVWYARRGLAFDGNPVTNGTSGGQGDLYIPVAPLNAAQIALFNKTMAPEQFVKGGSEIVAGSEYAPTAGALTAALTDLTTSDKAPQPACAPKYVILITNGQPTMGLHGHVYPPLGSAAGQGYGEVLSSGSADNDNAVTEAITAVKKLANYTNGGLNGIKTYVLGVGAGVNCPPSATNCTTEASDSYTVLKDLAVAGKTNVVYSADTAAAFQQAFNSILNNIAAQIVTASGGSSSAVIGNSSYEYVVTSNPSLGEGNMSAYLIKSSGNLASTASWDINAEMTTSNRSSVLYSEGPPTTTPGPITPLTSMDAAAFAIPSGSTLTPSIIEQYTIDPSYDSGNYLGGRQSGWYVGLMTANKPTYMGPPNDPNLLGSTGYDSYAQSESGRTPLVLVGSNDGFLYAVNAVSGSLVWGWMPRPLVQDLQDYSTFWQGPNMAGMRPRVVDAQAGGSSSAWATYIVGGAQQGAIQYALQLTSTGALNSEAWEQDNANSITPTLSVGLSKARFSTPCS